MLLKGLAGRYVASVTLARKMPVPSESKFDLPLVEDLGSEHDALREAMQYGRDLVEGLLPWLDPNRALPYAPKP